MYKVKIYKNYIDKYNKYIISYKNTINGPNCAKKIIYYWRIDKKNTRYTI